MNYRKALNITIDLAGNQKHNWMKHPCKEMSFEHVEDMMERIDHEDMSDTKLCRWLGWMQATIVAMTYPHTTLETMKNINKGCANDSDDTFCVEGELHVYFKEESTYLALKDGEVQKQEFIKDLIDEVGERRMTGTEALIWAAGVAARETDEMEETGLKHPEDSDRRDRCFARARTADHIKNKILTKAHELQCK